MPVRVVLPMFHTPNTDMQVTKCECKRGYNTWETGGPKIKKVLLVVSVWIEGWCEGVSPRQLAPSPGRQQPSPASRPQVPAPVAVFRASAQIPLSGGTRADVGFFTLFFLPFHQVVWCSIEYVNDEWDLWAG